MLSPSVSGTHPATRVALLSLAAVALLVSAYWLAQSLSPSAMGTRLAAAAGLLVLAIGLGRAGWRASACPTTLAPAPGPPPPEGLRLTTAQSLALQTRLLRGLPGPALLVRAGEGTPQPLACNADAQATLPEPGTPAMARMVQELWQRQRSGDPGVQCLELPGGYCLLWLPPTAQPPPPHAEVPAAPPLPMSAPCAPSTTRQESGAEDDDRAAIVYTVSHDLRAPIRVIEGFTRIVREDYGHLLDRVGNDHLERVLGAATRMNGMIDALLALSRLSTQDLQRVPVDLSALAHQVMADLCAQAPERQLELHIDPDLSTFGDPVLLRSVLENLLGNAWKYTARRDMARITFSTSRDSASGRCEYCVRDNGAGFDMRFASKLFGAFQRLHGATEFPGTGIGLASVRRIVRRHGGDIRADAAVNEGARFYFTLGH